MTVTRASFALLLLLISVSLACTSDSPTSPSDDIPRCCWTHAGSGDAVFTMPAHVQTVRVTASFPGTSSNFIVWIGPAGAGCSVTIAAGCRLIVNELLGTIFGPTTYAGTVETGGGGQVAITNSTGVAWTLTEVR